jgi:hypothetical protein
MGRSRRVVFHVFHFLSSTVASSQSSGTKGYIIRNGAGVYCASLTEKRKGKIKGGKEEKRLSTVNHQPSLLLSLLPFDAF